MSLDCPQWLDDDAREAWCEVVAELKRRGVELLSTNALRVELAAYCGEHAHWSFLARLLAECVSNKAGDHVPSLILPELSESLMDDIKNAALETWNRANTLGAVFSLSPADRIRIHNIPAASIPRRRRPGRAAGRGGAQA